MIHDNAFVDVALFLAILLPSVILHEIAHALTPGAKHGYTWKLKCIEIGGDGNTLGQEPNRRPEPAYALVYNGEVCKTYYRRPAKSTYAKLPGMYISSQPESRGRLQIIKVA